MEKSVKDEHSIRQFLRGTYGARGPNGELAFDPTKGVIAENLPKIGESRILNGKVCVVRNVHSLGRYPAAQMLDIKIPSFKGFTHIRGTTVPGKSGSGLTNDTGARLLRQRVQQAWNPLYLYVCCTSHYIPKSHD